MMDCASVLRNLNTLQPLRKSLRYIFLKETRRSDAAVKTFHRDWTAAQVRQHDGRNRFVVRHKLTFGDAIVGKQNLFRMSDHCLANRVQRADADGAICRARSTQ